MERHSRELGAELRRRGLRVSTITTALDTGRLVAVEPETQYLSGTTPSYYSDGWWHESSHALYRLHATRPVDAIWSQSSGAMGFIRQDRGALHIACVVFAHGTLHEEIRAAARRLESARAIKHLCQLLFTFHRRYRLWRECHPYISRYVAVSSIIAQSLVRDMGVPPDQVTLIPNGVDPVLFAPNLATRRMVRQQLLICEDSPLLVAVGRLHHRKNLAAAIRLIAQGDPRLHLMIVGSGPEEHSLKLLSAKLECDRRIHFLGCINPSNVAKLLSAADIFITPTLHAEGLPLAVLEAMACSLPVVAFNVGGMSAAVTHSVEGYLAHPGDATMLSDFVRALTENVYSRRQMGLNARRRVLRDFTIGAMADAAESVFRSLGS
jgi:glycosyltransferase involved in cell wall biosynthesis